MKPHTLSLTLVFVAAAACTSQVSAKGAAVDSKLPKEVQQMYCLVGEWRGDFKFQAGGDVADLKLQLSCSPTANGYGIACKARFTGFPGAGPQEETDLFGFDPGARKYHWFSVTSMGEAHDHVAEIPTSDTLRWVYSGLQEGKPMVEAIQMTFSPDSRRIELKNDGTVGGQPAWSFAGTMFKKE
jgi:hypothetical protein